MEDADGAEALKLVMEQLGATALKARRMKYAPKPKAQPAAESSAEPSVQELESLLPR